MHSAYVYPILKLAYVASEPEVELALPGSARGSAISFLPAHPFCDACCGFCNLRSRPSSTPSSAHARLPACALRRQALQMAELVKRRVTGAAIGEAPPPSYPLTRRSSNCWTSGSVSAARCRTKCGKACLATPGLLTSCVRCGKPELPVSVWAVSFVAETGGGGPSGLQQARWWNRP